MAVSHIYTQTVADGTATSVVRPSDWNSAHNQYYSLAGNTAGNSTVSGTNVIWQGGNNVTLSGNGATIVVSAGGQSTLQIYSPPWAMSGGATNSSLGQNTLYFQPFDVAAPVSGSRINFYVSYSGALSAGNSTGTCSFGIGYGLYTANFNSTASDRMSLWTSYSAVIVSQSMTSNTAYSATHYIGLSNATSHSTSQFGTQTSNVSTYQATNLNGQRVVALPLNRTLTPGRYWLGVSVQSVSGNGMTNNMSVFQTSVGVLPDIRPFGVASAASNASVFRQMQGWGSYSATSTGWPASIALTTDDIRAGVNQTLVQFGIAGYSTSTNIL